MLDFWGVVGMFPCGQKATEQHADMEWLECGKRRPCTKKLTSPVYRLAHLPLQVGTFESMILEFSDFLVGKISEKLPPFRVTLPKTNIFAPKNGGFQ